MRIKCFNKNIVLFILTVLLTGIYSPVFAADLNSLLKQKDQLAQQLQQAQDAAANKAKEVSSLSTQVSSLSKDIQTTESKILETSEQIGTAQKSIEQLSTDIDQKNKELDRLKQQLNNAVVEIYRSSSRSDLELLFQSDSLGESVKQQQYLEAIQGQVSVIYSKVRAIKKSMEDQKSSQEAKKAELDQLKSNQESYKTSVEYQKSQKDKILNMSVAQKAQYEQNAEKLKAEITKISSAIYSERQKRLTGGREILGGGGSGYPYGAIDVPDAWGFLTRECTSYAAWYWNVRLGKKFINTRPGEGSAWNWPALARDQGYSVSSTARVGAIITWGKGGLTSQWGHVAIVEGVNSDGTIDLSEYNWIRYSYSFRKNVDPGSYGSYSYIY